MLVISPRFASLHGQICFIHIPFQSPSLYIRASCGVVTLIHYLCASTVLLHKFRQSLSVALQIFSAHTLFHIKPHIQVFLTKFAQLPLILARTLLYCQQLPSNSLIRSFQAHLLIAYLLISRL